MTWQPTTQTRAPHTPRISVDEEQIPYQYLNDVTRHMRDGAGIDRAMTLAGIDADDRLLAWRAAS